MHNRSINILLLTTVLTFSTLYVPQPILPLLAEDFSVSRSEISLLISLTLFPLGLTPIFLRLFNQQHFRAHCTALVYRDFSCYRTVTCFHYGVPDYAWTAFTPGAFTTRHFHRYCNLHQQPVSGTSKTKVSQPLHRGYNCGRICR